MKLVTSQIFPRRVAALVIVAAATLAFDGRAAEAQSVGGSGPAATVIEVSSSPNPSAVGEPVTLSATVTANGAPVTVGSVSFHADHPAVNIRPVGRATLDGSGQASVSAQLSALTGTHTVWAVYEGTPDFAVSDVMLPQVVLSVRPTVIALTSSPNPSAVGEPVTITATVSGGGAPVTAGTVDVFATRGVTEVIAENVPVDAGGRASVTVPFASAGIHPVTVVYNSIGPFSSSVASLSHQVGNAGATTTTSTTMSTTEPSTTASPTMLPTTVPSTASCASFTAPPTTTKATIPPETTTATADDAPTSSEEPTTSIPEEPVITEPVATGSEVDATSPSSVPESSSTEAPLPTLEPVASSVEPLGFRTAAGEQRPLFAGQAAPCVPPPPPPSTASTASTTLPSMSPRPPSPSAPAAATSTYDTGAPDPAPRDPLAPSAGAMGSPGPQPSGTLPATGSAIAVAMALAAVLLLAAGAGLVAATTRRR